MYLNKYVVFSFLGECQNNQTNDQIRAIQVVYGGGSTERRVCPHVFLTMYRPSHALRCCTPAMGCSKAPALQEYRPGHTLR